MTVARPAAPRRPWRVVVCGTVFGHFYLRAVQMLAPDVELVGVLARGGQRSLDCARRYGVPCYTRVEQMPDDVDIACVVVRAAVAGGPGGELARALLARGVHVLQEQPVHPAELAECLRLAHRHGVQYRLNPFYAHLEPVRRFLAAARTLRTRRQLLFLDASCAGQVLYPLVDILGRTLGGLRPWNLGAPEPEGHGPPADGTDPFRTLRGAVAGVPVNLRVQHDLDPTDPDNHAHRLHQVTLGTDSGLLTLVSSNGPVLWCPRLHVARRTDGSLALDGPDSERLDQRGVSALGPDGADTFRRIFDELWPQGVAHALRELCQAILDGADVMAHGQYCLTTTRRWLDLTDRLGRPRLIAPGAPRPMSAAELLAGENR
ncbi:Gfo/Idh/MocA family oxidoreductase [Streptomyces celluloflavus]|uniref:Gfo/Idh/MocA family oxidoreductase n=1 Tax=Streptomyces celluloflavus TaxID=58344 RepID=UPI0036D0E473